MRILGFDQAVHKSGWAFSVNEHVEHYGLLQRTKNTLQSPREKLWSPQKWMRHQIMQLVVERLPDVVALEQIFLGENVQTLITLAEFRGAIIGAVEDSGLPIQIITVTSAEVNHYLHLPVRTKRAQKKARSQFVATADIFGSVQASDGGSLLLQEDISDSIIILRIAETKARLRALASADSPVDAISAASLIKRRVAR